MLTRPQVFRVESTIVPRSSGDHARNHAAFWDGASLTLTPAYDICPQNRTGREANQAMKIVGEKRASTLTTCLEAAPYFLLTSKAAIEIIEAQIVGMNENFAKVSAEASLFSIDWNVLWGRTFLNPYVF